MKQAFLAVAALALLFLLPHAARVGLAGDYLDPIRRITAQDEALYAASAIHAATAGDWLTPRFMGRYALYKPPLLIWAAGFCARVLGVSRLSLRLPAMLACALALGIIFLWTAELCTWQAGACAVLLVASNHLWHVLGSLAMTDALLAAFSTAALYALFCDPWLESRACLWGFSGAVAAAILTKSVAGFVPLAALAIYWLAAPPNYRPRLARVFLAFGLALALAAPWFLYQLAVHARWFWTEQVMVEILGYGAAAPPQTSQENQVAFYFMRMAIVDPVLLAVFLVAAPGFLRELRRRSAGALLLGCWLAVLAGSVLVWQYRNITYLLPMAAPMAIAATAYGPFSPRGATRWLAALVVLALAAKAATPLMPWGLSFAGGTVQPVAPLVSGYCARSRANELILVGADDDLCAAALPLPRLRYCLVGASAAAGPYAMDFPWMGISVTADQFNHLDRWTPVFRARLREWGLDSADPIATLILATSPAELAEVIRAHPSSDFLIPDRYRAAIEGAHSTHQVLAAGTTGKTEGREAPETLHWLLLARESAPRPAPPAWSCGLAN